MNTRLIKRGILAALMAAACSTTALADNPRHFLHDAIVGDNSEIMLGRLAQRNAQRPGVRHFADTLVRDHMQARDQASDLARRMGMDVPRRPQDQAFNERDRLRNMNGRDFDEEFVRYMIDDHRKDIRDFRDEARENHGPVSRLAWRQLPTLRKHLDIALGLSRGGPRFSEREDRGDYGQRYNERGYGDRGNDQGYNNQATQDRGNYDNGKAGNNDNGYNGH